jgi:CDP-diacylglycerol--glycerol-3-phosphate 3-phosphatidyltransferase
MIFSQQEKIFVFLLIINLITDVLDGFIARTFKLETRFGARLDTWADISMYIGALTGVVYFKADYFIPHLYSFSFFIAMFLVPMIISLVKFRKISSLHLYSSKLSTFMQGVFFFYLFTIDFNLFFYYMVIALGILSYIEQSVVLLLVSESKTNAKGLFWILKGRESAE